MLEGAYKPLGVHAEVAPSAFSPLLEINKVIRLRRSSSECRYFLALGIGSSYISRICLILMSILFIDLQ